jgi:hypothetical protein
MTVRRFHALLLLLALALLGVGCGGAGGAGPDLGGPLGDTLPDQWQDAALADTLDGPSPLDLFDTTDATDADLEDTQVKPPPGPLTLDSLTPAQGTHLGGDTVTLTGTGFVANGIRIWFGDVEATRLVVINDRLVNAFTPPHDPGTVAVTIKRWEGSQVTLEDAFSFIAPFALDSLSPPWGSLDGGEFITVSGGGFDDTVTFLLGGRPALVGALNSPSELVLISPGALQPGPVELSATRGTSTLKLPGSYTFEGDPVPQRVDPPFGPAGGMTEAILVGARFSPRDQVFVDEVQVPSSFLSPFQRAISIPDGECCHDLRVQSPWGHATLQRAFCHLPTETSGRPLLVPNSCGLAGGCPLTLLLDPPLDLAWYQVLFGDEVAEVLSADAATGVLTLLAPPATTPGAVDVTFQGKTDLVLFQAFTYLPGLAFGTLQPASGPAEGGFPVTVTGSGLLAVHSVRLGTGFAQVQTATDTSLTFLAPPGPPGTADLTLQLADGPRVFPSVFNYTAPDGAPLIHSVLPSRAAFNGGTLLTIQGAGFAPNAAFTLTDLPLVDVRVVTPALAYARSPRAPAGFHDIVLTQPSGSATAPRALLLYDPDRPAGGAWGGPADGAFTVSVFESGAWTPVDAALVLLQMDSGQDFAGYTDELGQLTISQPELFGRGTLTVSRADFDIYSLVDFDASNTTVYLVRKPDPSSGGSGGGGNGGEPWVEPESWVAGRVLQADKYIPLPPGVCRAPQDDGVCTPCVADADCGQKQLVCREDAMGIGFCTRTCADSSDCPDTFACTQDGPGATWCIPLAGRRAVFCSTTADSLYGVPPEPGPGARMNAHGIYFIRARPGQQAIYCYGGIEYFDNNFFDPLVLGIQRNVKAVYDQILQDVDITLNIPLGREARLGFHGLPTHPAGMRRPYIVASFDLGDDGFLVPPMGAIWSDFSSSYQLRGLPRVFSGPLAEVSLSIYAAVNSGGPAGIPYAARYDRSDLLGDTGLFTLSNDPATPDPSPAPYPPDAVVGALASGDRGLAAVTPSGVYLRPEESWQSLAFPQDPGTLTALAFDSWGRLWAASKGVLWYHAFDTWHRINLIRPVQLRALLVSGDNLYAVGDGGTVAVVALDTLVFHFEDWYGADNLRAATEAAGSIWFAGDGGLILQRSAAGVYSPMRLGTLPVLALCALPDASLLAVGAQGSIFLHRDTTWSVPQPPVTQNLTACATLGSRTLITGEDGVLLELAGASPPVPLPLGRTVDFRAAAAHDGLLWLGGSAAASIGPFHRLPGFLPGSNRQALSWEYYPGALDPTYQQISISDLEGRVFWRILLNGSVRDLRLPDLTALLGANQVPEDGIRVVLSGAATSVFDIDEYRSDDLSYSKRDSWSLLFEVLP